MFVLAGSLILWRNLMINDQHKGDRVLFGLRKENNTQTNTKKRFFIILSILVILSGFTSFILDQSWFLVLNYVYKIPIYSLLGKIICGKINLGVSICFTLSFMVIDIINYLGLYCQNDYEKPFIYSYNQYSFILIISCLLGIIYGLIFGIMDIEDLSNNYLKAAFVREQNYCIPIGLGFGCITGYMNEYIRCEVRI